MHNTKECIMCFSEIDSRAKKCPKCTSLQAKYSNLENNPILIGVVGVLILGIFGFIIYDSIYLRMLGNDAIKELQVTINEVSTKEEGETLYVACLGSIDNKTKFKFANTEFQVDMLSEDGVLVDTFSVLDEEMKILSNNVTNFRVRGIAHKDKEHYKQCKVKIVDAWAI